MAVPSYYGLKKNDGTIIQCAWTSVPVFYFCAGKRTSPTRNLGCYAIKYESVYYMDTVLNSDENPVATYGSNTFSRLHPSDPWISQGGSCTWYYQSVSRYPSLTPSTKTVGVGATVYGSDGSTCTICKYFVYNVTATTNPVGGTKVGNIALYDSSNNLLVGSVSKTNSSASSATISATVTSESTSVTVKFVATAVVGNTTSSKQTWHQKYFFNGIYAKGSAVEDASITFSEATAEYTASFGTSDTLTFVVDYGKKNALTISNGTGVSASTVSYTRHHSTGSYVTTSISPISLSGSGTFYVEDGSSVSASASCLSGYVFATNNGFISQTSGVSSIYGSNSVSIIGTIPTLVKAATFNVTASTYSISASISDHPSWGSVYIDSSGTTSKTLLPNTTYTFGFVSAREEYEAPSVNTWRVNGTAIQGNTFTTGNTLSGNVVVTCTLTQNAYHVSVTAGSNGSVSIFGRYNKQSGASLSNTGYLYADGRDYIKLTVTPEAHYSEMAESRVISNLTAYASGGDYCYSLTSAGSASAAFYFSLAECVIKTSTNDPTLCDVSPDSQVMRFDSVVLVNVYCYIKQAQIGNYRVDYFEMGGAHYAAEVGGEGQYYYSVSASNISGRSEATFVPHLVNTANPLTVTKSGDTSFAAVYVSVDSVEESISGSSWNANVRENKAIVCRAVSGFGGQISSITSTGVVNPSVTESQISFSMPSNAATVNFAISEKDKVTLALCVANATTPSVAVGKITLTCAQSQSVHEEVNTLSPQSFQIYKNTTYRLTADDTDATYTFAGWYLNDVTLVSTALYIDISRSDLSNKYTAKYVMRGTGTITTSYGIKSGDQVVPTVIPTDSQPFGLVIDTPPDQTNPDKWVLGNNRYIDFHVLDDGTSVEDDGTYVWTPVRVDVMTNTASDTWMTVWTYDANNPASRSGCFAMRDNMLVRCVYTKVQEEDYGRVQALFKDGNTVEMGEMSIFATEMLSYYSIGGVSEANCYIGRKAVLTASPRPGWSFGGWYKFTGGAFVPVTDSDIGVTVNGSILTVDSVSSSGCTYYADFAQTDSNVRSFGDGSIAKTFEWRSKVYVGSQFFALRNVRVYSDLYPVGLRIMTATSPNGCFSNGARTLDLIIQNQSPRHVPVMRLEKYFAFRVVGAGRINHVALASSMEALK